MRNNLRGTAPPPRARDLSPSVREFEIRPRGRRGRGPWAATCSVHVAVDGRERDAHLFAGRPAADAAPEVYRIAVKRAEPGPRRLAPDVAAETGDELRSASRTTTSSCPRWARRAVPAGGRRHRHHADLRHGAGCCARRAACACCTPRAAPTNWCSPTPARGAGRAAADLLRRTPASASTLDCEIAALPPRPAGAVAARCRCSRRCARPGSAPGRAAGRPALRDLRQQRRRRQRALLGASCRATACASRCRPSARCSTCSKTTA